MLVTGVAGSGVGFLAPLMNLKTQLGAAQTADPAALTAMLGQLQAPVAATSTTVAPFNMAGLVNGLCLLLLTPYIRGRLLDMGYAAATAAIVAWVLQVSVLHDTFTALTDFKFLPMAWLFSFATMLGYFWLTLRGSQSKKPVHERLFKATPAANDDFPKF